MPASTQSAVTPEFAFAYRELMLSTMVAESQTTKKVIAAIPEGRKDYKPDPKSKTAHELAWHIIYEDVQFLNKIADLKFDQMVSEQPPATIAAILQWYDGNFPKAIKRVRELTPEQLLTSVDFFGVMKAPVFQYLMLVNNHSVHHRGQLATYLRPMGSKVPSIYGGSADEPFQP
ncbi:MAG: DinB family protein [Terriglobales bacterium]